MDPDLEALMQKTGAGVAYRGDAALPASDLER
jgi:hypothetical protein